MTLCQPIGTVIGGLAILLTIIVFWDEIRTEQRFRAYMSKEAEKTREESMSSLQ
mgnify:CR=1 FL=1